MAPGQRFACSSFTNARRNFPTDTDGATRIWLAGGYDSTGVTDSLDGNLLPRRWYANSNTDGNSHSNCYGNSYCNGNGDCHSHSHSYSYSYSYRYRYGYRHRISNGDTTTRSSSYAYTAPSANTTATPITL